MRLRRSQVLGGLFLLLVYAYVLTPPALVVIGAFNQSAIFPSAFEGFSLRWVLQLAREPEVAEAARVSALVALAAALIAVVIGTPVAFAVIRHRFRGKNVVENLFLAPVAMPQLVIGLTMLQLTTLLGLPATTVGLVLAHALFTTPYVVRAVMINLSMFDRSVEEASLSLGANHLETLAFVTLPLIRRGLGAGFVFGVVMSFSNVPLSMFLTNATNMTLPIRMMAQLENRLDPFIAAVATLVMVATVLVMVFIEKVVRVPLLV